jgi:hypothetical protein
VIWGKIHTQDPQVLFDDARQNHSVCGWCRGKLITILEVKIKGSLYRPKARGGVEFSCTLSLNSTLDGNGWLAPRPGRFTPGRGRSGWIRKVSPPAGIRSRDRPDRSESLYRLRYLDPPHRFSASSVKGLRCIRSTEPRTFLSPYFYSENTGGNFLRNFSKTARCYTVQKPSNRIRINKESLWKFAVSDQEGFWRNTLWGHEANVGGFRSCPIQTGFSVPWNVGFHPGWEN